MYEMYKVRYLRLILFIFLASYVMFNTKCAEQLYTGLCVTLNLWVTTKYECKQRKHAIVFLPKTTMNQKPDK